MKTFALSLILGLNAIISHAAPSPVQHEARQTTDLSLSCTGATGSYEVEFDLLSQENFQNFNISESIPFPSVSFLILGPNICCSQPTERLELLSRWSGLLRSLRG